MCHVYEGINRRGLCFVYVNVWAGSKLMHVSILLHLGLVMQSRMCMGVATLNRIPNTVIVCCTKTAPYCVIAELVSKMSDTFSHLHAIL